MVRALQQYTDVIGTDISGGDDFFHFDAAPAGCGAIVTNPEFKSAVPFIERAIELMEPNRGFVAMLLRTDFGHAKTRQHLFGSCPQFSKKIELTKRIVFFERPGAAPSFSHSWFLWSHQHVGPPQLAYADARAMKACKRERVEPLSPRRTSPSVRRESPTLKRLCA
jgi:hypothetical protein